MVALTLALPGSAYAQRAEEVQECVANHEEAQVLRSSGSLKKAREALIACSKPVCPSVVRVECADLLRDVDKSMPTITVAAREKGKDVFNVTVHIDGELVSKRLDGKQIELDPGVHKFKVSLEGWPDIEREILISSGAKDREITFDFGQPDPVVTPGMVGGPGQPAKPAPPPVPMHRPVQPITYILLGTTVLGGVGFGVFGSLGNAEKKDLEKDIEEGGCKPVCSDDQINGVKKKYLIADISLGVGVASAAGALITFLARPEVPLPPDRKLKTKEKPPSDEPYGSLRLRSVDVAMANGGGSLRVGGEF